ncbi:hypothetical protein BFJ63_vAg16519 [Fusarium oxysporum f. sp. narcissi]|uniref:Uncharacterized protein n=2 Tax=Fusarium oxysporum TaxID=5507 RepID=A0A4V1RY72_FUSOX|nr:hypothetical protein HZ326_24720 [Fusarium oxysporum f. sp. albedinis]RKK10761.1 hypothetical protein BFJ65_g14758 [Fusarium oxysporum f. sp. cepae]RYC80596.1 hypothetical protein BFJ63_vAg16519 [Fusarium oxysporum f. sp. narcissi]KAK2480380.1 hypothetical protein H9L39_07948 [Fusarium oxysporum f. sp. albedinis]RKK30887.1 hypothetical protein BFJ67_g15526 [Fusarium oxysporum f. sp. cepae]
MDWEEPEVVHIDIKNDNLGILTESGLSPFFFPETQTHRLNPSPSAPVAFHGSPFIDLIIGSEIVPPQPLPHSREPAPLIDLTGSPDSPTATPHRDRTASERFRIPRPPPRPASSIFSNNSDHGMDRYTDAFDRRSATWRVANRNISTEASQPSATRPAQPTNFLEFLTSRAFRPLPRQPNRKPQTPSPPPTRVGFTRDTCADPEKDSENVAICPACGNELAYNPTSKRKRKREPEERPFWALKKCGHVTYPIIHLPQTESNKKRFTVPTAIIPGSALR